VIITVRQLEWQPCWSGSWTGFSARVGVRAADDPGVVFFLARGCSRSPDTRPVAGPPERSVMIWIQVRDVRVEHARLAAAGVPVVREPVAEPWGLIEMQIEDPTASGSSWSRFPPVTPAL